MQHDPRDLLPIRAFSVGVEQTQIGDSVFVIVGCQYQIRRCGSATSGSRGGFCMSCIES